MRGRLDDLAGVGAPNVLPAGEMALDCLDERLHGRYVAACVINEDVAPTPVAIGERARVFRRGAPEGAADVEEDGARSAHGLSLPARPGEAECVAALAEEDAPVDTADPCTAVIRVSIAFPVQDTCPLEECLAVYASLTTL